MKLYYLHSMSSEDPYKELLLENIDNLAVIRRYIEGFWSALGYDIPYFRIVGGGQGSDSYFLDFGLYDRFYLVSDCDIASVFEFKNEFINNGKTGY